MYGLRPYVGLSSTCFGLWSYALVLFASLTKSHCLPKVFSWGFFASLSECDTRLRQDYRTISLTRQKSSLRLYRNEYKNVRPRIVELAWRNVAFVTHALRFCIAFFSTLRAQKRNAAEFETPDLEYCCRPLIMGALLLTAT